MQKLLPAQGFSSNNIQRLGDLGPEGLDSSFVGVSKTHVGMFVSFSL